ncbi:hypothetical protein BCR36DRAFT_318603 [Piromyces finnis]|uniref:Uncharacterized protein n=1 Tax=Piromyces finnis TaxID=1754191 RepID=A0A1Y1VJW5_9FUNG|nr:hypothetical protein BCR36DRAFT_318603 [Piromyces finnis]|eukprot:ORX57785.1 hypothetical protein BCR36DRAFT_318603 [Piromyces finnis]
MFTDFLVNTFLMAGLPFLLNIYLSNKNRRPEDRINRPKTYVDKLVIVALIFGIIYELVTLMFYRPPSVFTTLNIPTDAPNWLFKKNYREYIVNTYGQEFASFDPNDLRPNQITKNLEDVRKFATLCKELEEPGKRATYLKYGENTYTQCSWCESDNDYFVFTISRSSFNYIYILALLGAATSTTRKNIWRFWSVTLVAGVALYEVFMYITSNEVNALKKSLYEEIDYSRHGLFIIIMALVCIFDRSDEKTNEELSQEIIDRTIAMINRTQATELCSVATLTDSNLRKMFIDYYEKKEVEKSVVFSSQEYNDVRLQIISKYNLEKMIENSSMMAENIMNNYRKLTSKEIPPKAKKEENKSEAS